MPALAVGDVAPPFTAVLQDGSRFDSASVVGKKTVVLVHEPTGMSAEASERRSQQENRVVAIRRLRLALALGHRSRALSAPSPLWRSRVRGGRLVIATTHDDYPALVAEALDQLAARGLEMPPTAVALGVTPSQLAGLFRKEPQAWVMLNRLRTAAGLPTLRARP